MPRKPARKKPRQKKPIELPPGAILLGAPPESDATINGRRPVAVFNVKKMLDAGLSTKGVAKVIHTVLKTDEKIRKGKLK